MLDEKDAAKVAALKAKLMASLAEHGASDDEIKNIMLLAETGQKIVEDERMHKPIKAIIQTLLKAADAAEDADDLKRALFATVVMAITVGVGYERGVILEPMEVAIMKADDFDPEKYNGKTYGEGKQPKIKITPFMGKDIPQA